MFIKKAIQTISSIADTEQSTEEEKRQHRFLIYVGIFMSFGGLSWGSISMYSDLPYQAMIPYGYGLITLCNFTYLYLSKNFQVSQAIQLFISLLLPFLFQLSLGGFVSSGAQVFWAITALLGAFTFKKTNTTIVWFILYIVLVIISGLIDEDIVAMNFIEVPTNISILFFTINITAVSLIIFSLFYYFAGSEKKHRNSLEINIENLKITQAQLIEAEKMSALGSLVAGVAHEVNTPLGVSVTAASLFKHELNNMQKMIDDESLSRTALNEFIKNLKETDELLIKNLNRASSLIQSFKEVSVDQSSDDIREFELNSYLKEVVSTLVNELKHKNVNMDYVVETKTVMMNTYPGALAQIIINLVQNSLVHGFENAKSGKITLTTQTQGKNVLISCMDNGKGVDQDVIENIFEPFVTTKRNQGGTGLGLNITYNLVVQKLQGSITLDTKLHQGCSFIISIPKTIL